MKRFLRFALLGALLVATVAAAGLPLPYYAVGPGPAREVEPLIHVSGRPTYQPQGRLIMTTVSFRQVTALGALAAWIDPHRSLVGQGSLYPPGQTADQEQRRSISQMDTSKIDATSVVLGRLTGYPVDHGPGVLIESVVPGCPAEGKLFAGDLVQRIDNAPISDEKQAMRELDRVPLDRAITFHVMAAGQADDVTLTRTKCVKDLRPIVGITMVDSFPFRVSISSGDVGGPSAGLMWALGLYDLLTPGDLTGGRTIAGTGTIDLNGKVGPIGGIGDKIVAAEGAGAQVFLVPQGNLTAAQAAADGSMKLVPVSTFRDALDFLQGSASTPRRSGS